MTLLASLRPTAIGIAAALRAPLWLHGARLRRALDGSRNAGAHHPRTEAPTSPTNDHQLERALRASVATLRVLGHARPLWRNTCLYRSMAQWLVLRAYGRRASVRIGVRANDSDGLPAVAAHAWVDYAGPEPVEMPAAGYETLRGPRVGRETAAFER